jgi:hypothetical protein
MNSAASVRSRRSSKVSHSANRSQGSRPWRYREQSVALGELNVAHVGDTKFDKQGIRMGREGFEPTTLGLRDGFSAFGGIRLRWTHAAFRRDHRLAFWPFSVRAVARLLPGASRRAIIVG